MKKRSEGFFGLHFDFHANGKEPIGGRTTPEMIQQIIDMIHPDFMQCDCKGHAGYASYPSKMGNSAPIVKDPLPIWRAVTEQNGVSLYMHYSGVIDNLALKKHPDWAARDDQGNVSPAFDTPGTLFCTSVFSPYADQLLIPQVKELWENNHIDGIWVDGDCWAVTADYSPWALKAYGKTLPAPDKNGMPDQKHLSFCREGFIRYLSHYTDVLHQLCPGIEIASNWAFSARMPVPAAAKVDFLSGDLSASNCVQNARYEARYLANQQRPWDLMAWSFTQVGEKKTFCAKTPVQLMQEAAAVIAQGGGFQLYYTQERDGSVWLEKIQTAVPVARFCRQRQPYCHGWKKIPQVAVLLSSEGFFSRSAIPFNYAEGSQDECKGILNCAVEAGLVVDLVSEHHLKTGIEKYAAIIVPDWDTIGNKDQLLEYTKNGGGLVVIGPNALSLFSESLGVSVQNIRSSTPLYLSYEGILSAVPETTAADIELSGASVLKTYALTPSKDSPQGIAATVRPYGRGKIAGISFAFGRQYTAHQNTGLRRLLKDTVAAVTDKLCLTVSGSENVEITLSTHDGKIAVGLLNSSGSHHNPCCANEGEIPPIGPLSVELKSEKRPQSVTKMPQNLPLPFVYEDGTIKIHVERVELYDILLVEF